MAKYVHRIGEPCKQSKNEPCDTPAALLNVGKPGKGIFFPFFSFQFAFICAALITWLSWVCDCKEQLGLLFKNVFIAAELKRSYSILACRSLRLISPPPCPPSFADVPCSKQKYTEILSAQHPGATAMDQGPAALTAWQTENTGLSRFELWLASRRILLWQMSVVLRWLWGHFLAVNKKCYQRGHCVSSVSADQIVYIFLFTPS